MTESHAVFCHKQQHDRDSTLMKFHSPALVFTPKLNLNKIHLHPRILLSELWGLDRKPTRNVQPPRSVLYTLQASLFRRDSAMHNLI